MTIRSEAARLTRYALGYGAGCVVMMTWASLFSTPNSGVNAFFKGLAIASALLAVIYAPRALWAVVMGGPEREAIAATDGLKWRHFYKGTGIALDAEKRELHLFSARTYRRYPLASVRTWERRHHTGGALVGQGLAVVTANMANAANNSANSGLFFEVRDVDHPVWRIAFPPRAIPRELPRWMEVLQQTVNEAPAVKDLASR